MAQEGIAAALTIPDDIMDKLKQAQTLVDNMAASAERMGEGFKTAASNISSAVNALGPKNFTAAFNTAGAVENLQTLSGTVEVLNKNTAAASQAAKELDKALRMTERGGMGPIKAKIEAIREALAAPGLSVKHVEKANAVLARLTKTYDELQKGAKNSLDTIKDRLSNLDASGNVEKMRAKLKALEQTLRELKALEKQGVAIPAGSIQATQNAVDALRQRITATNALMGITAKNANMVRGMLSAAFSPIMIASFLKNLVAVRGEFELAQKSLAVLIRSESMAADMFDEISRIAVRSPFSVMEMTKQVKQLAAYRIENEKLISTTKMLGDISAGVGVDMNRLILAYGQVKAATFLKGQELRQFSEAGVNMLGGLAERFTDIYKRAVSTGEVLQMVSKRMVKFEDVDAVLRKQTSEGGAFYKMQEKQAETLKGMVVNLQDRIQLMFNQTGTQFDTIMKKVVKGIEWVISHGKMISAILIPLITMKVTTGLLGLFLNGNLVKGMSAVALAAKAMNKELMAGNALGVAFGTKAAAGVKVLATSLGTIGWGTVIGALLAIGTAVAMWIANARAFKKEVEGIFEKANKSSAESVANYNRLVDIATDLGKADKERVDAIEELKREYGNILPIQNLELSNVQKLNGAREQQIELIREQIRLEANADAIRAASRRAEENAAKQTKELYKSLSFVNSTSGAGYGGYGSGDQLGLGFIQKYRDEVEGLADLTMDEVGAIRSKINDEILRGTITDANKARDEFLRGVLVRSGATAEQVSKIIGGLGDSDFREISKGFKPIIEDLKVIYDEQRTNGIDTSISRQADSYKKAINGLSNARKEFMDSLSNEQREAYNINPAQLNLDVTKYIKDQKAKIAAAIQNEDYGEIGDELKAQLQRELDRAFAKDGSTSPIDDWFNEQLALVNDKFPNMVKKLNVGELMRKENESFEDYSLRMQKEVKKYKQTLQSLYDNKGNEGRVKEIASQWGEDVYNNFVKSENAAHDLNVELKGLPEKISAAQDAGDDNRVQLLLSRQKDAMSELSDATQDAEASQSAFWDASKEGLETQIAGMEMFIKLMGAVFDKKAASQQASQYKANLKSFVNEVRSAAQEFDKLNDAGDKLLRDKLEATSKKLKVSLPDSFSQQEIDEWFKKLESKLPKEEVIEMRLAWNKNDTADAIKKLSEDASALWDKYDNAKKLEGWGLSFVGASSASIMQDIEAIEAQLRAENTEESIAQAEQIKQKRLQILRSEQEEAAKIMYEAQKKALSKTEQAYQDMFENIAKIRAQRGNVVDGVEITGEQVDAAVAAQIAKSMKEVANAEWDAYKSTEMYAMAFGDLKGMSLDVLEMLKEKLVQFKSMEGLDPADIQAVERAILKLNRQMATVQGSETFIGQLNEAFKAARDFRNSIESGDIKSAQEEMIADQTALRQAKQQVEDMEHQRAVIGENAVSTEDLAEAKNKLAEADDKAQKSAQRYNDLLKDGRDRIAAAKEAVDATGSVYGKITGEINEVVDAVREVADAIGGDLGPEAEGVLEGIQQGFKLGGTAISIASTAMEIYLMVTEAETTAMTKLMTVMWPLLAVAGALAIAFAVIKGRDKALEKQIEDSKYAVERLKVAYDELEISMNKAMDLRKSAQFHDQMVRNLNQQIAKLEEARALEAQRKSRGGKREEALDEFDDQINELKRSIQDANDEWLEFMGSFSDSRNEAKSWASSWLDAFKDAKSGVQSLSDSFDDMYEDIVTAQLADVLAPQIEQLKELISSAVKDGYVDEAEATAIMAQRQILSNMSDDLKKRAEELGIRVGGESGATTLQKGIESVTEQTAQALESYLNSTRAYVADNNRILLQWDEQLMNQENENSILANIRTQTRYLRTLSSIAQAVYSPGSTGQGAGGIKVFVMG